MVNFLLFCDYSVVAKKVTRFDAFSGARYNMAPILDQAARMSFGRVKGQPGGSLAL